jgi:hypothetical protein
MERKCDTARRCGDVGWRKGGTEREKGGDDVSWTDTNFTGLKNKELLHGQFSCYK